MQYRIVQYLVFSLIRLTCLILSERCFPPSSSPNDLWLAQIRGPCAEVETLKLHWCGGGKAGFAKDYTGNLVSKLVRSPVAVDRTVLHPENEPEIGRAGFRCLSTGWNSSYSPTGCQETHI